jgi:hypothetical protein
LLKLSYSSASSSAAASIPISISRKDAYQEEEVIPEEVLRIVEGGLSSAGGGEPEGGVWS